MVTCLLNLNKKDAQGFFILAAVFLLSYVLLGGCKYVCIQLHTDAYAEMRAHAYPYGCMHATTHA